MKTLDCLILIFISVCMMIIVSCGNIEGPPDAVLEFYPEYDYCAGYDIFPGGDFAYVASRYAYANTNFSPYFSHANITSRGYLQNNAQIYQFLDDFGDCVWDTQGGCTWIISKLYLAAVVNDGGTGYLGGTLNDRVEGSAICVIFVENIVNFAGQQLNVKNLTEAVVLHELGHGRADLSHLCSGPNVNTSSHNSPTQFSSCVMGFPFPRPACLASDDAGPLDQVGYCGKCDENLKIVTW